MQIVGFEQTNREAHASDTDASGANTVETIDVWYSTRRKAWLVERLDAEGHQIGLTHRCEDEEDAKACLAEWLRAHADTRLVASREMTAAELALLEPRPRRHAA